MEKKFKVFYRHPQGGYRYVMTVTLRSDVPWEDSDCREELFWKMQGENWSPNGEARELIETLGVQHTSMSVGDLVVGEDNVAWIVEPLGWKVFMGCEGKGVQNDA